jgi:raffinose/stachyose/melibiose transport system substrate-binding protein
LAPGAAQFAYLSQTENTTISTILTSLSTTQCTDAQAAAPLSVTNSPGATFDQKLQLLGGQDALPQAFMAPGTPSLMKQLISSGKVVDIGAQLESMGLSDQILPAAASTLNALYGTTSIHALPTEFNIEGIWYNKKILADNGIAVPATWDDLTSAATKLEAAGIQPMAASGKDGWPITRLIGDYLFRSLGPDALQKVADGQAKLTDPDYVKAADAIGQLGKAGGFGKAVSSVDYNIAMNLFLSGKAAMFYMGSWALANFNDPKQNTIGVDNIGFMPFPAVAGGAGSVDQVPANAGVPLVLGAKDYGTNQQAWLKCIANDYGDAVFKDQGVISGFKTTNATSDSPVTKIVQDTIASATSSVLWFEALFSAKGTNVSQQNAAQLANGSITGAEFMQLVQAANAG